MIRPFSKLLAAGYLTALLATSLIGVASPAMSQSVTGPTLSFPQTGTNWGCHFYRTCKGAEVVTKDR